MYVYICMRAHIWCKFLLSQYLCGFLLPSCVMSFICIYVQMGMGWLRLVASLKLQVSIAEYSLFYRALVQKRSIFLMSLLIVATPYLYIMRDEVICIRMYDVFISTAHMQYILVQPRCMCLWRITSTAVVYCAAL